LKIEQLLTREPFGQILETTLSRFFSDYYGVPHQVAWRKLAFSRRVGSVSDPDGERFFCNPFLNVILAENAGQPVFDFLRDNYRHTPHRRRRQLQKIYVALAANRHTARLFATYVVEIWPRLPASRNLVILGGNNRIRIIDLQHNRSWDILKDSFDVAYMKSELSARTRDGSWPFPRLGTVAHDDSWFEAEYVEAVSLNRLTEAQSSPAFLEQGLEFLGVWLEQTVTTCSASSYLENLAAQIGRNCSAGLFSDEDRAAVKLWLSSAQDILGHCAQQSGSLQVDLAEGHGDFQHGNILVGKRREVWVVDWEHAGKRQFAYDYLVFSLRTRFPSGLSDRILLALRDGDVVSQPLPMAPLRLIELLADTHKRRVTLLLFLAEELLWSTRENSNPRFKQKSGSWLQLKNEIGPALRHLADPCSTCG